jgi:hypothetical protein
MLTRGNLIGLGMFVIGAVIVAVGSLILKLPDAVVMISVGVALSIIDLALRFSKRKHQGWLTRELYGGYVFFAPVWVFGIIVVIVNIINSFAKQRP